MPDFDIKFHSHNRKARCVPNPAYPHGIDVDMSHGAALTCKTEIPYPAKCVGAWIVECNTCGLLVAITAAGRSDDPRCVVLPCKREPPSASKSVPNS